MRRSPELARRLAGRRPHVPRVPGTLQRVLWSAHLIGAAAFGLALTWDAQGHARRRMDPVSADVYTERRLDPAGWVLGGLILSVAIVGVLLVWRATTFIDSDGVTRRRLRARHAFRIPWAEVDSFEVTALPRRARVTVRSGERRVTVPSPSIGRAGWLVAVQRALDQAGRGVAIALPDADGELLATRQYVHDAEVALGRRPGSAPRPRLTRREMRGALGVMAALLVPAVLVGVLVASQLERRVTESVPTTTLDVSALTGTGEPDLSTLDGVARALAVRALATLPGATTSIDCDGRIPTEGGLAGVRYVSVRTAGGVWESTPAVAPPTTSTSWRLTDLVDSGVFATTGPLPAPSERWEIKVNTYLGPAWFGCKPVNRPAP